MNSTSSTYQTIPIDHIVPSPYQARKTFSEESIKELANTIKEQGLQQAVVLRQITKEATPQIPLPSGERRGEGALPSTPPEKGGELDYELISGERRLRAAKLLGWSTIEAKVVSMTDEQAAVAGLIENLQREDLNPIEEAEGFGHLQELDKKKWTQEEIAKTTGKLQSYVSEAFSLLGLSEEIRKNIACAIISRRHGVEIARLSNKNSQKSMAQKVLKGGWSVKKTREMVDRKINKNPGVNTGTLAHEQEDSADPLAETWEEIQASGLSQSHTWDVEYDGENQWMFGITLAPEEKDVRAPVADWFRSMAEALSTSSPRQVVGRGPSTEFGGPETTSEGTLPIAPPQKGGESMPGAFQKGGELVRPVPRAAAEQSIPAVKITEATYVRDHKIQLRWEAMGEGYTYRVFFAREYNPLRPYFQPVSEGVDVSTAGALVDLSQQFCPDPVVLAVLAIAPNGAQGELSEPIQVKLNVSNNDFKVEPLMELRQAGAQPTSDLKPQNAKSEMPAAPAIPPTVPSTPVPATPPAPPEEEIDPEVLALVKKHIAMGGLR